MGLKCPDVEYLGFLYEESFVVGYLDPFGGAPEGQVKV